MRRHALVTGGAGFIGSHLVRTLLERGIAVTVLDDFSTGLHKNLSEVASDIRILEGDIRNPEDCARACREAELVYHLAALGSVPRSVENPTATNAVNVRGTLNMLVAARDARVRRFVFSSSSSVYGNTPELPKHEELRPRPRSPYAVSKLAGEEYCASFYLTYGLETVSLRYFNVFGPRQNPRSQYAAVIPRFITALQQSQQPVIYGDGKQTRDFTYVDNVVEANLLAGTRAEVAGEVFNIACGERVSVQEVLEGIAQCLRRDYTPRFAPARPGDVRDSLADISLAQARLGYRPSVGFRDGLAQTVASYASPLPTAAPSSDTHELSIER